MRRHAALPDASLYHGLNYSAFDFEFDGREER
jgi:hypothetical protein